MSPADPIPVTQPQSGGESLFVSTRWTVVLSAGRQSSPESNEALSALCQTYWYPLYAYVRRQGRTREDAQDLTQAFFAKFLERNYLVGLSSERGRFRAFLLACLKHFLANEWDKDHRLKRGGHSTHLSMDWETAEERYRYEPQDITSPDRLYDREWAVALLDRVISRLKQEYTREGKADLFEHSRGFLTGGATMSQAEAAALLGLDEGAFRVAVHRMRKRYRQTLQDEIRQTLTDPAAVEEELRSLRQALREEA